MKGVRIQRPLFEEVGEFRSVNFGHAVPRYDAHRESTADERRGMWGDFLRSACEEVCG